MVHLKKGYPIFYEFIFGVKHKSQMELEQFIAEVTNMFDDLDDHNLTETDINYTHVLVSVLSTCRKCTKTLQVKGDFKRVILYDFCKGSSIAIRFVKFCRQCSIHEHAGYYIEEGRRLLDLQNFEKYDVLLSTEDTAFTKQSLRTYAWELVIGHMPFLTKAEIYNQCFGYTPDTVPSKRKR